MKKALVIAGAASAVLLGSVAVAQVLGEPDPVAPAAEPVAAASGTDAGVAAPIGVYDRAGERG